MKAWLPPGALVLVVLVMLPAQAEPKPFPDLVPAMLKIKYDHDMGSCTDVEWDQGRITVTQSMGGSPVPAIRPTLNDRTKFIRALNQARIYQWSNHYGPPLPVGRDGNFRWSIDLQFGDRVFHSDGNTRFPPDTSSKDPDTYKTYEPFAKAVSDLIGIKFP